MPLTLTVTTSSYEEMYQRLRSIASGDLACASESEGWKLTGAPLFQERQEVAEIIFENFPMGDRIVIEAHAWCYNRDQEVIYRDLKVEINPIHTRKDQSDLRPDETTFAVYFIAGSTTVHKVAIAEKY